MSKLFIIGNGFDIDHKLPTKYIHFKEYLENKYPNLDTVNFQPSFSNDETDIARIVYYLINEINDIEWNEFETNLSCMPLGKLIMELEMFDYSSEDNPKYQIDADVSIFDDIANNIGRLEFYFSSWVKTININTSVKEDFISLLNTGNNKFLTFNYTLTLEDLYQIDKKNICHIHGSIKDNYANIIFGHGGKILNKDLKDKIIKKLQENSLNTDIYLKKISDFILYLEEYPTITENDKLNYVDKIINEVCSFKINYKSVESETENLDRIIDSFESEIDNLLVVFGNKKFDFDSIINRFRKNTKQQMKLNNLFFDKIKQSDMKEIYSYGFSFSEVDLPYIKHICNCLDTSNITWFLNNFDNEDKINEFKQIISKCGFKGKFDTFSVQK